MPENLDNLRHSCAHLLAAAVMELWPHAKRTIGPAIENGFYFDFDFGATKISEADFPALEQKMNELLKSWKGFERHELDAQAAKKEYPDNEFKHELIDEFTADGSKVSFYKSGAYWDLCRGGHVEHPRNALKHFKLLSVAGAYWRGNEKNKMLTRIYGTCFPTKKELDAHLHMLEEAKKRDHRKIGQDLDLFTFADEVGPGLPLWKPKGTTIREELETWAKETEKKWGYERVSTPHIAKHTLFEISGHLPYYKDDMYSPMDIDGENYYLKGMNCPHHHMIYASNSRSYKDLPIRYADFSMLYRNEDPGQIGHNMTRVRAFSQDDSHIYCTFEQISQEFDISLKIIKEILEALGMKDYRVRLSTWDPEHKENYLGGEESWEKSQKMLISILEKNNIKYFEGVGEAAFYGPKADFLFKDSLGREWQLSTVQIDFNVPERFDLNYIGEDDKKHRPVVLHFAKLGSLERFMAIFIEHCAGAFPLWLSPVQVRIITVSDKQIEFAKIISEKLLEAGLRAETDFSNSTVEYKIRDSQLQKIPYTITIGDKEIEKKTLAVRGRDGKVRFGVSIEDFIAQMKKEIQEKK